MIRSKRFAFFAAAFFLSFALSAATASAQVTSLEEEQDFMFATGLFSDGNYQLACEKFREFIKKYPESSNVVDAEYYAAESQYQTGNLTDAAILFQQFQVRHEHSKLADDAGFREGEVYFRQGKTRRAHELFASVVKRYPEGNLAHEAAYWAGESAFKTGDYPLATKYYRIAYDHYPEGRIRDYAWFSLGFVYEKQGDFEKAIENYDAFLKEFPESRLVSSVYTRKGACMYELGNFTGTLTWVESLTDSPDPDNAAERLFLRAEANYRLAHFESAEQHYKSFINGYPDNKRFQQVQYSLGWAYVEQKKYSEAIAVFDALGQQEGELAEAGRFRKGMALRLNGNTDEAKQVFHDMIALSPRGAYADNAHFELGMSAYGRQAWQMSIPFFQAVTDSFPGSDVLADAHFMTGEALLHLGHFPEAVKSYSAALSVPAASGKVIPNARFRLGFAQFKAARYPEAVSTFKQFLTDYPADTRKPEALVWLGESHFKAESFEDAIIMYNQALALDLTAELRQDALYGLGWAHFRSQNFTAAETAFKTLTTEFRAGKHDVDANIRLGDAQYAMKHFKDAIETYRYTSRMYAGNPLAPYALLQLASAEHRTGSTPSAIATLKGLITKYPASTYADKAQFSLGWMYFQSRDYDVAIAEFNRLIETYPQSKLAVNARYSIADCYYNQGKYEQAESAYRTVLENHPDSPVVGDALDGIGHSLRMQGKNAEADRVKQQWLESNKSSAVADAVAFRNASEAAAGSDTKTGINALLRFIDDYPRSRHIQEAYLLLGQLYRKDGDIERADKTLRESISRGPASQLAVQAKFELADLQLQQQNRNGALAVYGELLADPKARSRQNEIYYRRGLVFRSAKDFAAAREDFLKARNADVPDAYSTLSAIKLAQLKAEEGQAEEAIGELGNIATNTRGEIGAEAQYHLGEIHFDAKNFDTAIEALLRVDYVFPDGGVWNARALLLLGRAHEAKNENATAKQMYGKVLEKYSGTDAAGEAENRLEKLK